ncbi:putative acetyltransferase [Paenarthrobacter nicotinovorans]|uniref:putative acetyltransferase n=1 Tax=Paenarthrobacter nicotinovorans TaxID=29320 RepID=UPI003F822581
MTPPHLPPRQFLLTAEPGIRVVVRYRIDDGLTDALGYLLDAGQNSCTVRTRTSDVEIPLAMVIAAKEVPPPPPRRQSIRHAGGSQPPA